MKQFIKKTLMLIAALSVSLSISAYDFEVDGIYYNITSMADLEVGVTHKYSPVEDYIPVQQYNRSYSGKVSIPSTVNYNNRTFTVTSILPYAIGGNINETSKASDVTEVLLPNTIEIIDSNAFRNCMMLSKCEIPESVIEIRDEAFYNTALTEVVLHGTTIMGKRAFIYCVSLNTVVLGENIETIPSSAFYGCGSLHTVIFGKNIETISSLAFYGCGSLHTVIFGENIETISSHAFHGCGSLHTVILGKNIETISSYAFSNCTSLLEVFFTGNKKPNIEPQAFSNTNNFLEIYVPSVKTYGFGREYLSFASASFDYTGQPHNIEWTNNLKAYKCEIAPSDCITEANAGQ